MAKFYRIETLYPVINLYEYILLAEMMELVTLKGCSLRFSV